jgi:16S rRNA (adenine1518-N6/adenine1519-N6)-dimethyltransferase
LAARLDLRPTKRRGQNFVHDANTVRRIVAAAGVRPGDVVLEVGPGLGSLTLGLLEAGAEVIAIEIEPVLAAALPQTVSEHLPDAAARLTVLEADALRVTELPAAPNALVANLPYNVSVPVLLHLLARFDSIRRGLVMVQAEVADRLVAKPGSKTYGAPSAKLAWYATSRRVGSVPASVFWPVPNVESGLVEFTRHPSPPRHSGTRTPKGYVDPESRTESGATFDGGSSSGHPGVGRRMPSGARDLRTESGTTYHECDRQEVFAVIDAAFAQRRKMLRSALAGLVGSSTAATEVLLEAGVDPEARGEVLGITDFCRVAKALATRKNGR